MERGRVGWHDGKRWLARVRRRAPEGLGARLAEALQASWRWGSARRCRHSCLRLSRSARRPTTPPPPTKRPQQTVAPRAYSQPPDGKKRPPTEPLPLPCAPSRPLAGRSATRQRRARRARLVRGCGARGQASLPSHQPPCARMPSCCDLARTQGRGCALSSPQQRSWLALRRPRRSRERSAGHSVSQQRGTTHRPPRPAPRSEDPCAAPAGGPSSPRPAHPAHRSAWQTCGGFASLACTGALLGPDAARAASPLHSGAKRRRRGGRGAAAHGAARGAAGHPLGAPWRG